jgi:hypothetical protein
MRPISHTRPSSRRLLLTSKAALGRLFRFVKRLLLARLECALKAVAKFRVHCLKPVARPLALARVVFARRLIFESAVKTCRPASARHGNAPGNWMGAMYTAAC